MDFKMLNRVVKGKQKGAFSSILYETQLPVRAAYKNTVIVTKRSRGVVRFGIEYDNLSAVKQDRALGVLPTQNAGLTWGTWLEYPYYIEHKGNRYLRCSLVNGGHFDTEYYINGHITTKEACQQYCTAAAFPTHENPMTVFSINIANILDVR